MNKIETQKMLMVAFKQWPDRKVDEGLSTLWWECFKEIDATQFFTALMKVVKASESKFPPLISEVNKVLLEMNTRPEDRITEGEAWGIVKRAISKFGSYQQPEAMKWISDMNPRLADAVRQIGWQSICMGDVSQEGVLRAHFWKCYQSLMKRDITSDTLGVPRSKPVEELERRVGGFTSASDTSTKLLERFTNGEMKK